MVYMISMLSDLIYPNIYIDIYHILYLFDLVTIDKMLYSFFQIGFFHLIISVCNFSVSFQKLVVHLALNLKGFYGLAYGLAWRISHGYLERKYTLLLLGVPEMLVISHRLTVFKYSISLLISL